MTRVCLFASLCLFACDDGASDPPVEMPDAAPADAAVDAAPPAATAPEAGTWLLATRFVELGVSLDFQADVTVAEAGTFGLTLRAVNSAGRVSDDLVSIADIAVTDGRFTAVFPDFLLPSDFSPVGDVTVNVTLEGELREAGFLCGRATGEAVSLMLDLGEGTFGAVPQGEGAPPPSCDGEAPPDETPTIHDERPARLFLPAAYGETDRTWPLVISLHGFGSNGSQQNTYLSLGSERDSLGFILLVPEGNTNPEGEQYWNATPACCDNFDSGVDDVAYLTNLLDLAQDTYAVDPQRVYLVGHSNGGFMAYRLACAIGERIAGMATLAGSTVLDEAECTTTAALSVLHIHGADDPTIPYAGDPDPVEGHPSAPETAQRWATRAGCGDGVPRDRVELVESIEGAETAVTEFGGCRGARVALWTIEGGGHVPPFAGRFGPVVLPWLLDR